MTSMWLSCALVGVGVALSAQTAQPAFDVVSIKRAAFGLAKGSGAIQSPRGNRLVARDVTARTLIRFAYGISDGDRPLRTSSRRSK